MFGRSKEKSIEPLRTRVFISYSRKDKDFAEKLVPALEMEDIEVFIDKSEHRPKDEQDSKSIAVFEDWWKRLEEMISKSDTVIFVISPSSMESKVCQKEVDFAKSHHKRFAPIVWRDPCTIEVPKALSEINYLFFNEGTDFEVQIKELITALKTNVEWIRKHTDYTEKALAWKNTPGRNAHKLLQGKDIELAEQWRDKQPQNSKPPGKLLLEYIMSSRQTQIRSQRRAVVIAVIVVIFAIVLASTAVWQRGEAKRNEAIAKKNEQKALRAQAEEKKQKEDAKKQRKIAEKRRNEMQFLRLETQRTESGLLSRAAAVAYLNNDRRGITDAVLFALEGLPDIEIGKKRPVVAESVWQLDRALRSLETEPYVERKILADLPNFEFISEEDELKLGRLEYEKAIKGFVNSDGTRHISSDGFKISLIDTGSSTLIATLPHDDKIHSMKFSKNGKKFVTTCDDGKVRIWDAKSGKHLLSIPHPSPAWNAEFSPDNKFLLTASLDNSARIWNSKTGKLHRWFKHNKGPVWSATFSPNGDRIVTSQDKVVWVWDVKSGAKLAQLRGNNDAKFSNDGKTIITSAGVWEANKRSDIFFAPDQKGFLRGASLSNQKQLAIWTWSKMLHIWNISSGQTIQRLFHNANVVSADFSPDGVTIATGSADNLVRIWDIKTGNELRRLYHSGIVSSVHYSVDGKELVTASHDKFVRVWNPHTGKLLKKFYQKDRVFSVYFSRDASKIIAGIGGHEAFVLNATNGNLLLKISHELPIESAIFNRNGLRILTASRDKTARLWEVKTGKELLRVRHMDNVNTASFSVDEKQILTSSHDKTSRVWDIATGKELARFKHSGIVSYAEFVGDSRSGKQKIFTASQNLWRIWNSYATTSDLIKAAKRRVARCLTQEQRLQFFLPLTPPRWCITGAGFEREKDPNKWQPKYPYHTKAWKDWLIAKDVGKPIPLPAR